MTARIAQEGAGRNDRWHGDEDDAPELTADEQQRIDARADELMAERIGDRERFQELMLDCDFAPQLFRALQNLDNACGGSRIAIDAVLTALCQVQRTVHVEAESAWREECVALAERELREQGVI